MMEIRLEARLASGRILRISGKSLDYAYMMQPDICNIEKALGLC